jgi:hypothetical protein
MHDLTFSKYFIPHLQLKRACGWSAMKMKLGMPIFFLFIKLGQAKGDFFQNDFLVKVA